MTAGSEQEQKGADPRIVRRYEGTDHEYVEPAPGWEWCPKCNGEGSVTLMDSGPDMNEHDYPCGFCNSEGLVPAGATSPEDEICADCGWLGPWQEMYRVKYPNDLRPSPREHGFYLCRNCWDRLVGAAVLQAIR